MGAIWAIESANAKDGPVIATVGGFTIHRNAFDAEMEKNVGRSTLTNMITQQLVLNAAKQNKVTATSAEVQSALQTLELQNNITSTAQLQQTLAQNNLTLTGFLAQLKLQVLAQKIAEAKVQVTGPEVTQYYAKNKMSFLVPEKISLSAIFLKDKASADKTEQALKGGMSFATAAKKYSLDPTSAQKGGVMGSFSPTQMDAATAKAALSQPLGVDGVPIHGSTGWEILSVSARKPAYTPTLAAVKPQIIKLLKSQKAETITQLMTGLAKNNITISDPAYASIKTQIENPTPAPAPTASAP